MLNKIRNKLKSEDNKRLLSNFFSLSILQGANYILPLITLPYLVRVLGIEYFGLLAFATALIAYFSILTDYGFNLTATKDISIHRDNIEKVSEIFSSVMTIKFVLMIISFILMSILIFSIEKLNQNWEIYFLTFGTVIGQVLFPIWFFQGLERMKYITYLNILAKSIFTIAIFIFVQEQNDFYIVPLLTSLGFIVAGIWSLIIIRREFKIAFKFQKIDTLIYYLKDGWDIFVSSFAGNFYRNFNTLMLGFLTNDLYTGYYAIAEKIIKIVQMLQNIVGNVLFPYLSKKIHNNKNLFFELDYKYIKYIIGIYFIGVVLVFIFSPYIIYFINGEYNGNMTLNLKIMSIVILIGGLNYYYGILGLITMNYKKEFSRYVLITGISNIVISYTLVLYFSDLGASLSLVLSESILLIMIYKKINHLKIKTLG